MRKLASKVVSCARNWACAAAASALFASVNAASADVAKATKVGNPQWQPVGFSLFSAPFGTAADNYAEFYQSGQNILPPPHWVFNPSNSNIAPGTAEAAPFDNDITNGVAANHYRTGPTFTIGDFSNGNAVQLGWIVIPTLTAPTGKSPDSANGTILPNSLFPIHQTGLTTRNGVSFDPNWDFDFADINNVLSGLGRPTYDGFSRMPFFEAENLEFGPGNVSAVGNYVSTFHLRDTGGNGWDVTTSYTVAVPEPASLILALPACWLLIKRKIRPLPSVSQSPFHA